MSEIKNNDSQELNRSDGDGFKQIKPEQGTTLDKAKTFIDGLFSGQKDDTVHNLESEKVYKDDHGEVYRVGDHLQPNKSFEVNGYSYRTDKVGRVVSAEGQLRLRNPEHKRNMDTIDKVGKGDQKPGDQRGHSIGYQFEGSGGIENLSAMSKELNQGDYKAMEDKLANAIKDGHEVYLKVEPVFKGDSFRPTKYRVAYTIDGEKTSVTFRN